MKIIYIVLFFTLPFCVASQQLFDSNSRLTIQGGIDPATIVSFRYEHRMDTVFLNRDMYPFLEFSSSMTRFGFKNAEIKLGQRMPLWKFWSIQLISGLNTSMGSVETINFDSKKVALEGDIAFGWYWKKSFLALTASYEKIIAAKLSHSEYYKDRFYSDAKDGWYNGTGGSFQFGLEWGLTIKKTVDFYMELKVPFTEDFNAMMGSPGHVTFGLGYRL